MVVTDESPSPAPVPSPAPSSPGLDVATFRTFAPAELLGMSRHLAEPMPVGVGLIAGYRGGDREIDVNIGIIDDAGSAMAFYASTYPGLAVARGFRAHTFQGVTDDGRHRSIASVLLRDRVEVSANVIPSDTAADAVVVLEALDLPGLVALAERAGVPPSPLQGPLTFTADEARWAVIEADIRTKRMAPWVDACRLHARHRADDARARLALRDGKAPEQVTPEDLAQACTELDAMRRDCRPGRYEAGLLEGDIELTPAEDVNFHRLWQINCALAGAPVPVKRGRR